MEDPLIHDHGSSSSSVGNRKVIHRRSDAIAYGNPYQKAAALVDLAEDGDGLPAELLDECRFSRSIKLYFVYNHLNFLWSLNLFAMVVLNFLEIPLWCTKGSKNICHDRQTFYLGELPYLSPSVSLAYEGFTIVVLAVQTFFPASYIGMPLFWRNSLNKIKVIFFIILVGDLLLAALLLTPGSQVYLLIRIAPYIRVMFVILNLRELRDCMMILAGMVRVFLDIMVLWLLFLLAFSWLAYVMFEDTSQGKIIFTSYGATLYQMFVLFTTSNNPDVWIPAYKDSRWYCLFFVLFVLVGVYFVTNLILAVVYDSFKDQLAQHILGMDSMRRHNLKLAFSLIDEHGRGYLTKEQCIFLFEELNKYRSLPQISHEDYECIFYELDDSGDFKINVEEFADFCNAISLKFQKETVPSWFEKYPWYHSPYCEKLKAFVRSPTFEYMIVGVLVLNLVAVIIETTLDIENSSAQKLWQKIEFVLGWIYVIEMILKVFSYGFSNYWRVGQNRFDFIVTCVIVLGESTSLIFPLGLPFLSNWEWIRYLLIARILRLIRLLMHVKRYRAFIATFCTLMPSLMPYLGIIFCLLCLYCSLGVQLFGGLIYIGNPKLEGTDLLESDYLVFNFNDYPNGMVTLFNLLVMGNWQDWMQSYVQLTGTSWTIIYFASFYIISVLLLLNMVVSFVLEAFFAEIELESADRDATKDNQNANLQRRTVSWKGRSGRVDALLHHMLSAELEKTQCDKS